MAYSDSRSSLFRRLCDRLSEPAHLNLISLIVAMFGNYRTRVDFDLVRRRHYAYGVLRAAEEAKALGLRSITVAEMGVATGVGLVNMCNIAEKTTRATGVRIQVRGFDGGTGLPPPADWRDHPELFQAGDYPMDRGRLEALLPSGAKLVLGPVADTVPHFAKRELTAEHPIGFVAIDVDYYSSALDCLRLLSASDPQKYLPLTIIYLDDISDEFHNRWSGELLAVEEFNRGNSWRKIESDRFLRSRRVFKNAAWIDHIRLFHVLDHPLRQTLESPRERLFEPPVRARFRGR